MEAVHGRIHARESCEVVCKSHVSGVYSMRPVSSSMLSRRNKDVNNTMKPLKPFSQSREETKYNPANMT